MTTYPHSLVIICPSATRAHVHALGEALGWTGENLSVALSPTGSAPITHYGCHTWATLGAVAIFTGQVTPEIEGHSRAEIEALRAQLIVSVDNGEGREHFEAVCAGAGLQVINPAV